MNNPISLLQRIQQQTSSLSTKKPESTFDSFKSSTATTSSIQNNQISELNSILTPPLNRYKSNDDEINQKNSINKEIVKQLVPTTTSATNSLNQAFKQQNLNKNINFPPKPPSKDKT